MTRTGVVLLMAGLVLAAGCGGEGEPDRTGYEELKLAADTSEDFEEPGAAPVVPVQGDQGPAEITPGGPLTATGNLRGLTEGAPPGVVTVTEAGQATTVLIDITRYTVGTELRATLVRGPCEAPGDPITDIGDPFEIGSAGIGTLRANIPVRTREILDGRHSVRVTTAGAGDPEMVLACANLPAIED